MKKGVRMKKLVFTVLSPIFSRQHEKIFVPGETVEFAPNPANPQEGDIVVDFDKLVEMGVIAPVEDKPGEGV